MGKNRHFSTLAHLGLYAIEKRLLLTYLYSITNTILAMDYNEQNDREEIYSKPVRAGKRTYFFDVKSTRGEDLYITITESKKRFRDDGTYFYEKHKIFLYKEDFEKFVEGINEAIDFVRGNLKEQPLHNSDNTGEVKTWSNVEFEDLEGQ